MSVDQAFSLARTRYAALGIDAEAAVQAVLDIPISLHCWQGDDVSGHLFRDQALSGGIMATGSYPGRAQNAVQLRADLDMALSLIPGRHKLNLHAIYADTEEKVDLDGLTPRHFERWVEWAAPRGMGLDFNPTCFSHPMAASGLTISHADPSVADFWVRHCQVCRVIAMDLARQTGQTCVLNLWFPDGMKDTPADIAAPRARMAAALDRVFQSGTLPGVVETLESKVFGIGSESYVVGSNEFCLGYAATRNRGVCLDTGHFHPTESVADKIPTVLLYVPSLLLHLSRPVRWDSDHVVTLDDTVTSIAHTLVRTNTLAKTHIGLDYFDASINRVAAWVIGARNARLALLQALLEPVAAIQQAENAGDYTARLAITEQAKTLPWSAVWDYACAQAGVPTDWLDTVRAYERDILKVR